MITGRLGNGIRQCRNTGLVIQSVPSTPLAALAHMQVGLYLKFNNHWDEAIDEFQKGIAIIPGTRQAHDAKTSIACIYTSRGMYDAAIALLKEVLAETKDWDQLRYCSSWLKKIYMLRGMSKQNKSASCGPKALSVILKSKGMADKILEEDMAGSMSPESNQVSMEELRKIAAAKGLSAFGLSVTIDQLSTFQLPVIALR